MELKASKFCTLVLEASKFMICELVSGVVVGWWHFNSLEMVCEYWFQIPRHMRHCEDHHRLYHPLIITMWEKCEGLPMEKMRRPSHVI